MATWKIPLTPSINQTCHNWFVKNIAPCDSHEDATVIAINNLISIFLIKTENIICAIA